MRKYSASVSFGAATAPSARGSSASYTSNGARRVTNLFSPGVPSRKPRLPVLCDTGTATIRHHVPAFSEAENSSTSPAFRPFSRMFTSTTPLAGTSISPIRSADATLESGYSQASGSVRAASNAAAATAHSAAPAAIANFGNVAFVYLFICFLSYSTRGDNYTTNPATIRNEMPEGKDSAKSWGKRLFGAITPAARPPLC